MYKPMKRSMMKDFIKYILMVMLWKKCSANCNGKVIGNNVNVDFDNTTCTWSVEVSIGKKILLNFTDLSQFNCYDALIEIRDGNDSRSSCGIGKFSAVSSGNTLSFQFNRISSLGNLTIFSAVFSIFECGGKLTEPTGTIQSPGYGTQYPQNIDCVYTIEFPKFHTIYFTTADFELESRKDNACDDYVEIKDRVKTLGVYCANDKPKFRHSEFLQIRFRTNNDKSNTGFIFRWTVCGGNITGTNGFSTPDTSDAVMTNCNYIIMAPPGDVVLLKFSSLTFEGDNGKCLPDSDYLQIFDGDDEMSPLLVMYCKTLKSNYFSVIGKSSSMRVKFFTDGNVMDASSEARAITTFMTLRRCGGQLSDRGGSVNQDYNNEAYPHFMQCSYNLIAEESSKILLGFTKFSLQNEVEGHCVDYVEIKDSFEQRRYCRDDIPTTKLYENNKISLNFVSDSEKAANGFLAKWSACGGSFEQEFGIVENPKFTELYKDLTDECTYNIGHPNATSLIMYISVVSTSNDRSCSEKLEFSGMGETQEICAGDHISKQVISETSNVVMKHTFSGISLNFRIQWIACGVINRDSSNSFQLTKDMYSFMNGTECSYTIMPENAESIVLEFVQTDLEYVENICDDVVQVFDGVDEDKTLLEVITSNLTAVITSNTGAVHLKFNSSCPASDRLGFEVLWDVCSTALQDGSGNISSPRYPDTYPGGITCRYNITVENGKNINLTFIHFNVGVSLDNRTCVGDYIEIYYDLTRSPKRSCGQMSLTYSVTSVTNNMVVVLSSKQNSVTNFTGFHAIYSSVDKEKETVTTTTTTPEPRTTPIISYAENAEIRKSLIAYQSALAITVGVLVFVVFAQAGFLVRQRKTSYTRKEQNSSAIELVAGTRENGHISGIDSVDEADKHLAANGHEDNLYDAPDKIPVQSAAEMSQFEKDINNGRPTSKTERKYSAGKEDNVYSEQPLDMYDQLHKARSKRKPSGDRDEGDEYTIGVETYGRVQHNQIHSDELYDTTVNKDANNIYEEAGSP